MIRRRQLLAGAGLGLAGAAFFGPRRARAAWGEWPEAHAELALPPERRAGRVLELYAYGGMCPWDTFYCMPEWGLADQRYLHAFGEAALAARLGACGLAGALAAPFATDDAGQLVHLGPWAAPLRDRPDLLARILAGFEAAGLVGDEVQITLDAPTGISGDPMPVNLGTITNAINVLNVGVSYRF